MMDVDEVVAPPPSRLSFDPKISKVSRDLNHLRNHQPHVYPVDFTENVLASTQRHPEEDLASLRESKRLTSDEITDIFLEFCPVGTVNCASIHKLFTSMISSMVKDGSKPPDEKNMSATLKNLNLTVAYNKIEFGNSCLFRCIDFCLNGPFIDSQSDDYEAYVEKGIFDIKDKFSKFVLHQIDSASSSDEKLSIMTAFACDKRLHNLNNTIKTVSKLTGDEFVSKIMMTAVHNTNNGIDAEETATTTLKIVRSFVTKSLKNGCLVVDIACNEGLFRDWIKKSDGPRFLRPDEVESMAKLGIYGFILPAGYLHHGIEGGDRELQYIPEVLNRQVILVDFDNSYPFISMFRSSKGLPYQVKSGFLGDMYSITILTSSRSGKSAELMNFHPMIICRKGAHFRVLQSVDDGDRLQQVLLSSRVFRDIICIFTEQSDFLLRVAKDLKQSLESCKSESEVQNKMMQFISTLPQAVREDTLLVQKFTNISFLKMLDALIVNISSTEERTIVYKLLTEKQKSLILHQSYELSKYQLAFCRLLVRYMNGKDPAFFDRYSDQVAELIGKCNLNKKQQQYGGQVNSLSLSMSR